MTFHDFAQEKSNKHVQEFELWPSHRKCEILIYIPSHVPRCASERKGPESNTKSRRKCLEREKKTCCWGMMSKSLQGHESAYITKPCMKESPKRIYKELNARESKQMSTELKVSRERRRCKGGNLGNRVSLVGYINFIRG